VQILSNKGHILRKAEHKDKAIVTNILAVSFKNDPQVNWYLEESRNRNKLNILVDYVFEETIRKGEIYLSEDNMAAALWNSAKKEKFSLNYIYRNLSFLFRIGIKSTIRILKMINLTYCQFPLTIVSFTTSIYSMPGVPLYRSQTACKNSRKLTSSSSVVLLSSFAHLEHCGPMGPCILNI